MAIENVLDARVLAFAGLLLIVFLILYAMFTAFALVGLTPGEVAILLFLAPFLAPFNFRVAEIDGAVIGVNVAGLFIPAFITLRFLVQGRLPVLQGAIGIAAVAWLAFVVSRVEPEQGILVPALPIVALAAFLGLVLAAGTWDRVGPITYSSGAMGTLIGADLMNLDKLADPTRDEPLNAVIGGAGTLDAIYLVALVAVLFAIIGVVTARAVERLTQA